MSFQPGVGRALYKSLHRYSSLLETELSRCGALRARELDALKRAASQPLPKDLRGLLDVRPAHGEEFQIPIQKYVSTVSKRVADAALSPQLEGLEGLCGFAALKHLSGRLSALQQLVYKTTSDALTHGIRVEVASSFQGFERSRFMFRYQIRISNSSQFTMQLLSRVWTIADLDGRVSTVEGPGVVGAFPVLAPKEVYEYTSGVPLQTPMGTQSGYFIFHQQSGSSSLTNSLPEPPVISASTTGKGDVVHSVPSVEENFAGRVLQVRVAPFSYRTPSLDERADNEAPSKLYPHSSSVSRTSSRGRRRRTDEQKRR